MSRLSKLPTILGLAAILAAGAWFRVTSPTSMPTIDADEAFFGIQANRLLDGHAPAFETYTGNVVSPFNAGLQAPLIAAFGPRLWILRAPTIAAGLLAIAFTAAMFRATLGRPTAWSAAALVAAWPLAILSSRIGYDAHLTPLLSVLVLGFAFQGRGLAMALAWIAALSAHPTNLFLLPIALPVFVVRGWSGTEGEPRRRVREFLLGVVVPSLIGLAMGIAKLRTSKYHSLQDGPIPGIAAIGTWGFVSRLGRLLLGVSFAEPTAAEGRFLDAATISVIAILLAGLVRLIHRKAWDRVALIGGTAASVAGFRIVGGVNCLMSPRYALFAVVPVAVALACAFPAWNFELRSRLRSLSGGLGGAAFGASCLALLGFAWWNGFRPFEIIGLDAPMTLRVENEDSFVSAASILLRDGDAAAVAPGEPIPVYAETEWVGWPLMYLTAADTRLAYSPEWAWKYGPEPLKGLINQALYSGGYVVGTGDGRLAGMVESMHPPWALRCWDFRVREQRRLVVYRFNRPGERPEYPVVIRTRPVGETPVVR